MYKESEKPTGSDYLKNNFNGKEAEEEKKKVQEIEKEKLKLQEEVDKFKLISAELEAAKSKVSELTKEKGELETIASSGPLFRVLGFPKWRKTGDHVFSQF